MLSNFKSQLASNSYLRNDFGGVVVDDPVHASLVLAKEDWNLRWKAVDHWKHVGEAVVCDEEEKDAVDVLNSALIDLLAQEDEPEDDGNENGLNDGDFGFHGIAS